MWKQHGEAFTLRLHNEDDDDDDDEGVSLHSRQLDKWTEIRLPVTGGTSSEFSRCAILFTRDNVTISTAELT